MEPMKSNAATRLAARTTILATMALAVVVGAVAPSPAQAADGRTGGGEATQVATEFNGDGLDPTIAAYGGRVDADTLVLVDFTPDPDESDGAVVFGPPADELVATVEPSAATGATVDDLMAGEGCLLQCITSGVAYARGVGALVAVTTHIQAEIWIQVYTLDGSYNQTVISPPGQIEFSHHFDDLEPGHTYHAMAVAVDPQGHTSHAFGQFVTLERHVTISMSHAELINSAFDSSLFSKHVWVEGQWMKDHAASNIVPQGPNVVWGNESIVLTHVDRHLDLALQLLQTHDPNICNGEAWVAPLGKGPAVGSDSCYAWAYAELPPGADDLDDRPNDADSWVAHTLQRTLQFPGDGGALPPGYGEPLDFVVNVTLHVTYS
jgi:hypothetical protein